jgi:hypothetical protein
MEFKVSVDSIIDIITNSSTEIFTFPSDDAEEMIRKVIDTVLKESGSEKECDDLFTISRDLNSSCEEDFRYWLEDHEEKMGANRALNSCEAKVWIAANPDKADKLREEFIEDHERWGYGKNKSYEFIVKSKSGVDTKITDYIAGVFNSEEISN